MKQYFVYGHYTQDTGDIFYIGIGKERRRLSSKRSRNKLWHNVSSKHGFYYVVLFEFDSLNECFEKEKELIELYGRRDVGTGVLVNMTSGGEGAFNLSKESRNKISVTLKGIKRSQDVRNKMSKAKTGVSLSQETKRRMSESAKKVDKSYMIGRSLPEDVRAKISQSNKGKTRHLGRKLSEEHKAAIRAAAHRKVTPEQLDIGIKMIADGHSRRSVARFLKVSHPTINKYLNETP